MLPSATPDAFVYALHGPKAQVVFAALQARASVAGVWMNGGHAEVLDYRYDDESGELTLTFVWDSLYSDERVGTIVGIIVDGERI